MLTDQRYWFYGRRYGWGLKFPIMWQGRLMMAIYVTVNIAALRLLGWQHSTEYLTVVLVSSALMLLVYHTKSKPT